MSATENWTLLETKICPACGKDWEWEGDTAVCPQCDNETRRDERGQWVKQTKFFFSFEIAVEREGFFIRKPGEGGWFRLVGDDNG